MAMGKRDVFDSLRPAGRGNCVRSNRSWSPFPVLPFSSFFSYLSRAPPPARTEDTNERMPFGIGCHARCHHRHRMSPSASLPTPPAVRRQRCAGTMRYRGLRRSTPKGLFSSFVPLTRCPLPRGARHPPAHSVGGPSHALCPFLSFFRFPRRSARLRRMRGRFNACPLLRRPLIFLLRVPHPRAVCPDLSEEESLLR